MKLLQIQSMNDHHGTRLISLWLHLSPGTDLFIIRPCHSCVVLLSAGLDE